MSGGLRLFCALSSLLLVAAAVNAANDPKPKPQSAPTVPPDTPTKPVVDILHGTRVIDNYRWLEDGASPATQKWVEEEMAYTRALLDPLPGREPSTAASPSCCRLAPSASQKLPDGITSTRAAKACRTSPSSTCAKACDGKDRVLIDPNQLAADGTIALDWCQPSENGRYVAYGTSPSGSEMSTLHVIETKTGNVLPDTIERTRAASIAWLPDNSGFYYTRYPEKGDVAAGQEMYNRHVFYHDLGDDPAHDHLIFGEGRDPEDWPNVDLSNDGRWLLIDVEQGWTKIELYLMDLKSDKPPSRLTTGKNFLYRGEIYEGKLYITTNEDAPRYRVFVTDAGRLRREHWQELIPQIRRRAARRSRLRRQTLRAVRAERHFATEAIHLDGKKLNDIHASRHRHGLRVRAAAGTATKSSSASSPLPFAPIDLSLRPERQGHARSGPRSMPPIDPAAYEVKQEWFESKDGTRVPMFVVHKKGLRDNGKNPTLLYGYGGFNISLTPDLQRAPLISGSSTAASSPWPTCAAAASSARTGTAPACSTRSRTSSTTSSPPPSS